ncbi:MAG: hypothetical protein FH758_04455 [Firmicutes bacterium]|nr:hypothetical protein [Bacillota bacterium]
MDTKKLAECFTDSEGPEQLQCVSLENQANIDQDQDVEQVNWNEQTGCNVAVACGGVAVAVQYADQVNSAAQTAIILQTNQNAQAGDDASNFVATNFGFPANSSMTEIPDETNFDAKMDKNNELTVNGKKMQPKDFGDGLKMFVLGQMKKSKNVSDEVKA